MAEPQYIANLKAYGGGDPSRADVRALEREMWSAPDRGAALLIAAVVERAISHKIKIASQSALYPGGTFERKIHRAWRDLLIGPVVYGDLTIVRHIRNQFAHSRLPITFGTLEVREACEHLQVPDLPGVHLNFGMLNRVPRRKLVQASNRDHPRTRYFTACNEIAQRVYFVRGGDAADPINQLP